MCVCDSKHDDITSLHRSRGYARYGDDKYLEATKAVLGWRFIVWRVTQVLPLVAALYVWLRFF